MKREGGWKRGRWWRGVNEAATVLWTVWSQYGELGKQWCSCWLLTTPTPTPWDVVCGAGPARLSGVFTPGRLGSLALGGAGRAPGAQAHAGARRQRH